MLKKIHWLVPFDIKSKNELLSVNMASIRLRVGCFLNPIFNEFTINFSSSIQDLDDLDYIFIAKIGGNNLHLAEKWLHYATSKKKIFVDITDDHLNNKTSMTEFYKSLIRNNPEVITSSHLLKEKINSIQNLTIDIIEDPIEIEIQKIHA